MSSQIRPEQATDFDEIRRVVTSAFESAAIGDLVDRIRTSPEYRPELSMVAVDGNRLIGHVMISGASLRNDDVDRPIVMLSPLAVDSSMQRTGVGAELVRAVTAAAREAGEPFVVLEGSPAYYSRFGFEPAAAHGVTMPLPDWAPIEAAQILWLSEPDPRITGHVVYPAAFDGIA